MRGIDKRVMEPAAGTVGSHRIGLRYFTHNNAAVSASGKNHAKDIIPLASDKSKVEEA